MKKFLLSCLAMAFFVVSPANEIPESLYLLGNFPGTNGWEPALAVKAETDGDGIFIFKDVAIQDSFLGYGWFAFFDIKPDGSNWGEMANGEHWFGPAVMDTEFLLNTPQDFYKVKECNWKILGGSYTFTVDFNSMKATASGSTGVIEDINDVVLYVRGDMNSWEPIDKMTQDTYDPYIFTYTYEKVDPGTRFKIADSEWGRFNFGGEDMEVYSDQPGVQSLIDQGEPILITNWTGGPMEITFNLFNKEITVVGPTQPLYDGKDLGEIDLYVRGDMNDWSPVDKMVQNAENPWMFSYSYEYVEPGVSFKIADSEWGIYNFGGSKMKVYSDVPGVQTLVSNSNSNISISNWVGGPMEISFNLRNLELVVKGTDQPEYRGDEKDETEIYVRGNMNNWSISDKMNKISETDEIYYFRYEYLENTPEFKIADEAWDIYNYGGHEMDVFQDIPGTQTLYNDSNSGNILISNWNPGPLELTFNLISGELTVIAPNQPLSDGGAGLNNIYESKLEEPIIYNLQGIKVNPNKLSSGLYIIDGKKIFIK